MRKIIKVSMPDGLSKMIMRGTDGNIYHSFTDPVKDGEIDVLLDDDMTWWDLTGARGDEVIGILIKDDECQYLHIVKPGATLMDLPVMVEEGWEAIMRG